MAGLIHKSGTELDGLYLQLLGGTMSGDINMSDHVVSNAGTFQGSASDESVILRDGLGSPVVIGNQDATYMYAPAEASPSFTLSTTTLTVAKNLDLTSTNFTINPSKDGTYREFRFNRDTTTMLQTVSAGNAYIYLIESGVNQTILTLSPQTITGPRFKNTTGTSFNQQWFRNIYFTNEAGVSGQITGDVLFDSTTKQIKLWNGSSWSLFMTGT